MRGPLVSSKPPFDDLRERYKRRFGKTPKICCWCRGELTGRQSRWCGKKCVNHYIQAQDPRSVCRNRDKEVCASCGLDCRLLNRCLVRAGWGVRRFVLKEMGLYRHGDIWDADHIIPLWDGGDHHSDNLQTLCIRCHKIKTATEASRRASK